MDDLITIETAMEDFGKNKRKMKEDNGQQIDHRCQQEGDQRGQEKQDEEEQYEEQQIGEAQGSGVR